jgi:hypothetical protein
MLRYFAINVMNRETKDKRSALLRRPRALKL